MMHQGVAALRALKLLTLAQVFATSAIIAQTRADTLEIERVVAQALHDSLKTSSVAFDSRVLAGNRFGDERPVAHVEGLAKALHARPAHESDVLACAGNPGSCQLSVDLFVALARPRISRTAAMLLVRIRVASHAERVPIYSRDDVYSVGKIGGKWKVTDIHTIRTT